MKKIIILATLFVYFSGILSAQDSITNPLKGYQFTLKSCVGNTSEQTITVAFTVLHQLPHQKFSITSSKTKAYANGNICTWKFTKIGAQSSGNEKIPTKTPVICEVTFRNVLPDNEKLQTIFVAVSSANADGGGNRQSGILELHDIPIKWK